MTLESTTILRRNQEDDLGGLLGAALAHVLARAVCPGWSSPANLGKGGAAPVRVCQCGVHRERIRDRPIGEKSDATRPDGNWGRKWGEGWGRAIRLGDLNPLILPNIFGGRERIGWGTWILHHIGPAKFLSNYKAKLAIWGKNCSSNL